MAATTQPITISQSRSHPSYAWTAQSPMSFEGGSASSISVHPAPIFIAGSFGSVGSVGGTGASFGSRFYPACSPGKIINPLDPNDFKCRISSSIDSEHGQFIKALNGDVSLKEDELCRNYTCCGQPLNDFHALVEHFEETHVVVFDHNGANNSMNHPAVVAAMQHAANSLRSSESSLAGALGGGSGVNVHMSPTSPTTKRSGHTRNSLSLSMTGGVAAFDPDDMELDVDSPASSASTSSSPESSDSSLPQRTSASSSSSLTTMNANPTSLSSIPAHQSSSFSTPPDTPLLSTPISPLASSAGFGSTNTNNNSNSSLNGHHQGPPYIWGLDPTQAIPTGPAAFETTAVHLPPKSPRGYGVHSTGVGAIGIGGGMHSHLVHPYASTLQQHRKHSLYKLQSFSSACAAAGAYSAHGSAATASALNGYAGYSDYSSALPGTIRSGSSSSVLGASEGEKMRMGGESSIPPSLLFCESGSGSSGLGGLPGRQQGSSSSSGVIGNGNGGVLSEENTPLTTPAQSRAPSPTSALVAGASSAAAAAAAVMASSSSSDKEASGSGSGRRSSNTPQPTASTTLSRPGASLLLNKPFKCPKPGCMKSYKQANGLKYHLTHGQCNFNPPAELASVEGLSEREAERKLRPFCCQVPPCQRRYKNMNGLRYHYQHSGDHGAIGLALLQSGNHDATKSHPSPPSISLDTALAPSTPSGSGSNTPVQVTTPLLAQIGGGVTGVTQGTFSAPGTPGGGMNGTSGMQFSQMQGQAGMVGGAYATQSQPASAYATPWGSRSGSPFGGAGGMGGGEQQQVQTMAQRFAGLASGQWVS